MKTISNNTKQALRKSIKKEIDKISDHQKLSQSDYLSARLMNHEVLQKAKTICIYQNLADEISFDTAVKYWIKEKKILVYPKYIKWDQLKVYTQKSQVYDWSIDVCVIPWRAFTLTWKRLGRGGGWYDRFLENNSWVFKIGVCYSQQIVKDIPQEYHDIAMDLVISSV